MRKFLLVLLLPTLIFASMKLECGVFAGAWESVTKQKIEPPAECFAETKSMAAFSKNLDRAWILDSDKYIFCEFSAPNMNYSCIVNSADTTSIVPSYIVNTYYNLKKFLH